MEIFLIGKKEVTRYETVKDDSAQQRAIQQQQNALARIEDEEKDLEAKLNSLQKPKQSSEYYTLQMNQTLQNQRELEQEYNEANQKIMEDIKKNSEKACKNMRRQILLFVEQSQDNFSNILRNVLEQMKKGCIKAVQDLLNINLTQQLDSNNKKLEELIKLIETEGEERAKKLNYAIEQEKNASDLLSQGVELSAILETQLNDHVEQESL